MPAGRGCAAGGPAARGRGAAARPARPGERSTLRDLLHRLATGSADHRRAVHDGVGDQERHLLDARCVENAAPQHRIPPASAPPIVAPDGDCDDAPPTPAALDTHPAPGGGRLGGRGVLGAPAPVVASSRPRRHRTSRAPAPVPTTTVAPPPPVELPGGGQVVFPGRRLVALYGHPGAPALGVLGEQDVAGAVRGPGTSPRSTRPLVTEPVVPAFEIIATVAEHPPGPDGDYSPRRRSRTCARGWTPPATPASTSCSTCSPAAPTSSPRPSATPSCSPSRTSGWPSTRSGGCGPASATSARSARSTSRRSTGGGLARRPDPRPRPAAEGADAAPVPAGMISGRDRLDTTRAELAVVIHADGFGPPSSKFETWNGCTRRAARGVLGLEELHTTRTARCSPRPRRWPSARRPRSSSATSSYLPTIAGRTLGRGGQREQVARPPVGGRVCHRQAEHRPSPSGTCVASSARHTCAMGARAAAVRLGAACAPGARRTRPVTLTSHCRRVGSMWSSPGPGVGVNRGRG